MTVLVHCLVLSSVASLLLVDTMGDRWAWGFTDWSLKADRKIDNSGNCHLVEDLTSDLIIPR